MTPKTWFVTGASRGLGRVWTQAALKRGDKVAATARNPETLADLVDTFRLFGKLWVTQAALPYLREQESDAAPRTYTMPPPAKR
jgi:NAD(P)-dependent dehydrogenase (short-subunit alcohol dehydrogenase family)